MTFDRLVLVNFGTYGGRNSIELSTHAGKPIVLIGGTNGAGKTTILNAILLCLHGRRGLPGVVSASEYEDHIRSQMHKGVDGARHEGSEVLLSFHIDEAGRDTEYEVKRCWKVSPSGGVKEDLFLSREGQPVDDIPKTAWQDFLNGLVPPGVARLFLFDGERIQAMAEDDDGGQLLSAVQRLLGTDLVEQLRSDLLRYVSQHKNGKKSDPTDDLSAAVEGASRLREDVLKKRAALEEIRYAESMAESECAEARDRFVSAGGGLVEEQVALESKRSFWKERIEVESAEMKSQVAGLLPFCLCPKLSSELGERLEAEESVEAQSGISRLLKERNQEISVELDRNGHDPTKVLEILRRVLDLDLNSEDDLIHPLSRHERSEIEIAMGRIIHSVPGEVSKVTGELMNAEEELARVEDQLARVPAESDVSSLLAELRESEAKLSSARSRTAEAAAEVEQAQFHLDEAERRVADLGEQLENLQDLDRRVAMALQASRAVESFGGDFRESKIREIEEQTARYFNRLSRKGDLLSAVSIDPETFEMRPIRWDATELPRKALSAGEKQLLAIAVLWSLSTVSGHQLPVVIDTPLARLDRVHRRRLADEYLPAVSHQVIILSTDTEIDGEMAADLAPLVSHSLTLDHDPESCATTVRRGYFKLPSQLEQSKVNV